jgi:hypothetical protein
LGTEIRTFTSLKDLTEYNLNQITQNKSLFEDYSQWLGTVLRDLESTHKNDDWFKKSQVLQKTLKAQSPAKKAPEADKSKAKKGGKGATEESVWVETGEVSICFSEQGQTEILFEAIEKIKAKMTEFEKFKATIQQLTRLGLGATINYIVYLEEDIPKKIVLKQKGNTGTDAAFKFDTLLSVPAFFSSTETP